MSLLNILLHPKRTERHISALSETVDKLNNILYGGRKWQVEKTADGLKVTCPCQTEAKKIETCPQGYNKFACYVFTCPKCGLNYKIPMFSDDAKVIRYW